MLQYNSLEENAHHPLQTQSQLVQIVPKEDVMVLPKLIEPDPATTNMLSFLEQSKTEIEEHQPDPH
jgi:hypothetical protein